MKKEILIWSNINLDEDDWEEGYKEWMEINGYDEDNVPMSLYEYMCDTNGLYLDDERANLDEEVDGIIVVLAAIGAWDGTHLALGSIGTNVKNILSSECDYCKWYCDRYNARFEGRHHDGSNHYLYRVAPTRERAEWLKEMMSMRKLDEKKFKRYTKSLRPYIASAYGWK